MVVFTADAITELSKGFIESLDRSALGRFAISHDLLLKADIEYRTNLLADLGYEISDEAYSILGVDPEDEYWELNMADDTRFEVQFWWQRDGNNSMQDFISVFRLDERMLFFDKFDLIVAHPNMHNYFAVDIWDVDVIKKLIRDDVDAGLAVQLAV